jgi:hypothetical protein
MVNSYGCRVDQGTKVTNSYFLAKNIQGVFTRENRTLMSLMTLLLLLVWIIEFPRLARPIELALICLPLVKVLEPLATKS